MADEVSIPYGGGALLVDKPEGPTSHDVVRWARKSLGVRRIGHTGTLDPFASGLLVLLVGPVTRLAEYLSALPKTYQARARLGVRTDTDDAEGKVVSLQEVPETLTQDRIEAELATFMGLSPQVPPQFSAKKVGGERMYKRARRGDTVQLQPVDVEILAIRMTVYEPPEVSFTTTCSSGTYVRAIARDLGDRLGVGAHLIGLRRTRVGAFAVERAVAGDDLREGRVPDLSHWIEPADAVGHLVSVHVDAHDAQRLRQGRTVAWSGESDPDIDDPIAVIDEAGLVGIAKVRDGRLEPKKIIARATSLLQQP